MPLDLYLAFVAASRRPDRDPGPQRRADRRQQRGPRHAVRPPDRGRRPASAMVRPSGAHGAGRDGHARICWPASFDWLRWAGRRLSRVAGPARLARGPRRSVGRPRPQARSARLIFARGFLVSASPIPRRCCSTAPSCRSSSRRARPRPTSSCCWPGHSSSSPSVLDGAWAILAGRLRPLLHGPCPPAQSADRRPADGRGRRAGARAAP